MKRSMTIAGLAAVLALPCAAGAQQAKQISFGVSGGASLPMGDLADVADVGFNVTGHIALKLEGKPFHLRGDVSYDKWNAKKDGGDSENVDASLSALGFTGNLIFPLGDASASARPYLLGGGGFYRLKAAASAFGVGVSTTDTKGGVQGGAGIEFKLSGMSTFLEAKYVNVFSDGGSTNWIPITFGIKF